MTPREISQGPSPYNPEDRPSFGSPFYPASWKILLSKRGWRSFVFELLCE